MELLSIVIQAASRRHRRRAGLEQGLRVLVEGHGFLKKNRSRGSSPELSSRRVLWPSKLPLGGVGPRDVPPHLAVPSAAAQRHRRRAGVLIWGWGVKVQGVRSNGICQGWS